MSPRSKIFLEIHINCMMHRKNSEKKITELRSPKKWKIWRDWDSWLTGF